MNTSEKKTFNASQLRIVLTVLILLLVGGGGAGFAYGYSIVDDYAAEVAVSKSNEAASANTLSTLNTLESQLETNAPTLEQLNHLYINSELPQFQAIQDIRNYAERHSLPVSAISFVDSGSSATPTQPSSPSSSTQSPSGPSAAATSGKYIDVTLTLSGDVNYQQLLDFLYDIEYSMPFIKVGGVSLSAGEGGNVKVSPLNLQVLAR